jgi:hypothetical protein
LDEKRKPKALTLSYRKSYSFNIRLKIAGGWLASLRLELFRGAVSAKDKLQLKTKNKLYKSIL